MPPNASGVRMPVKPISANFFHSSREKPVSSRESRSLRRCDTGALAARKPRALSRSKPCSWFSTSGMAPRGYGQCEFVGSRARQLQDALGDDVELHLAG